MENKFRILRSIEDDAPFGDINWLTISFLTPQKIETLKHLPIKGFKIHDGYNSLELANADSKLIKTADPNHDVYVSQMGKLYAWDDATKTDEIEFDNDKLNSLERTRRENIDKAKLMKQQFKNEYEKSTVNPYSEKKEQIKKRMQQKLYEKGTISAKELELIQSDNISTADAKILSTKLEEMDKEIDLLTEDYLIDNSPRPLRFGLVTIFSPKKIKGLKILCIKVRGIFQTLEELNKRSKKLIQLYPHDPIYQFEIGKWTPFSDEDSTNETKLKQLNYAMYKHLGNLEVETEEFEKRKEEMKERINDQSKLTAMKNRRSKRKGKKEKKEEVKIPAHIPLTNNSEDNDSIQEIVNYLDDPELRDRFAISSNNKTDRIEVNI